MTYEYKVIPAPTKGLKAKGVKSSPDRFANALQTAINVLAAEGWEYVRAETLPSEEREGLMGKTTVFQNMLIFRKPSEPEMDDILGALPPPNEEPDELASTTDEGSETSNEDTDETSGTSADADSNTSPTTFEHPNDDVDTERT